MARAVNNGWDFVKVGEIYQYKEEHFVGMVKVLKDESDDKYYRFTLQVQQANCPDIGPEPFQVSHNKEINGVWSGMPQLYETPEYVCLPIGTPWLVDYTKEVTP